MLSSLNGELLARPAIISDLKRRKRLADRVLLDLAIHQDAFGSEHSEERENIGRPEIVHHSLLEYLYSPVVSHWKSGLKMIVHTTTNNYFRVPNGWNPPQNYFRFRGLMELLLFKKKLETNAGLIPLKDGSVHALLQQNKSSVILTSHGEKHSFSAFQEKILRYFKSDDTFSLLIGGYQHGGPSEDVKKDIGETIALPGGVHPSWVILNLCLNALGYSKAFFDSQRTKDQEV